MQVAKDTESRLVFRKAGTEKRVAAVITAVVSLGAAILFYVAGGGEARIFAYIFGACGLFCVVFLFLPSPSEALILDLDEGLLILRVPSGTKRRVYTVPFDIIAGVSVQERGNHSSGFYRQVEFAMTETSRKKPLKVPVGLTGMFHDAIHASIVR